MRRWCGHEIQRGLFRFLHDIFRLQHIFIATGQLDMPEPRLSIEIFQNPNLAIQLAAPDQTVYADLATRQQLFQVVVRWLCGI